MRESADRDMPLIDSGCGRPERVSKEVERADHSTEADGLTYQDMVTAAAKQVYLFGDGTDGSQESAYKELSQPQSEGRPDSRELQT